ncbi:baseplate wedge subunit [Synechococcus phage DSL-LC03]|nr:baseplate wedge subunit [Synechococcus phage DSL-LC03]
MAQFQVTNLDFDQIKQSIKDYLRANSNFTDYDFEGSNLSTLIDILAYNTYITSYNTNAVVNEVFLDTALVRENVVALARNIGYVPKSARASRLRVNLNVVLGNNISPPTLTLKSGLVATSSTNNIAYTFSIPQDITVSVTNGIAKFNDITLYEGTYASSSFTVDKTNPYSTYVIDNENVDTSTLAVKVYPTSQSSGFDIYTQVSSIVGLSTTANKYLIQEVSNERYELLFGDGIISKELNDGNVIEASYIITNGPVGNGVRSATYNGIIVDDTNTEITNLSVSLSVVSPSRDGSNIEPISAIKYFAPRRYATRNRAVSSQDYETIVQDIYPTAEAVVAYGGEELNPPQYGKVFIVIKPKSGNTLSQFTKDDILSKLKTYSIAGIVPTILDMKYLYVELDSTIYYQQSKVKTDEDLKTEIISCLNYYSTASEANGFGGRIKYSKILGLIDGIDDAITSNITKIKMRRDLNALINQPAQYELCFGNKFHVKSEGYSIKSSKFTVSGIEGDLYLADIPDTGSKTSGKIIFFTLDSQGKPVIAKSDAGKIDYSTGEINIDTVTFLSTSFPDNIIEVEAIPESNDVIGLKDLYLRLSVSNSKFTLINDTLTSDINQSGTQFTSTSSYSNGKYTR